MSNLYGKPPYSIEPTTDDESEYSLNDADDEQLAIIWGRDDVPGSARALAELFVRALEGQQP